MASFSLQWALEQAGNIRIDTHKDNHPMQNLLRKLGFTYCGGIYLEDGSPRIAFQKVQWNIISGKQTRPDEGALD